MTRFRLACAIGLALLTSGISLAVTLPSLGILPGSPVMQLWPAGANNRARTAALLVTTQPGQASAVHAADMARRVLSEEPVNVVAARTLGLTAAMQDDNTNASRIFGFAESLSRRDKPTQLFLIEDNVKRGNVAGALRHYDRVLRNSPDLRDMLFPILRGAAQDPGVAPQLAALIARRPLWWAWFVQGLINDPADSSSFLYSIAVHMRPSLTTPAEREFLIGTVARLVATGQAKKALALYQAATGIRSGPAIRDGGFERSPILTPLDWQFIENDGFGAIREAGDDGTTVLKLNASVSQGGTAAQQALLLKMGSYRLTLRAGGIDPALRIRPTIRIYCQPGGRELLVFELHAPGAGQALVSPPFDVPAGCAVQWLAIDLNASESVTGNQEAPWIDDLSVTGIRQ